MLFLTVLRSSQPLGLPRWGDAPAFPGSGCAGAGLGAAGVPGTRPPPRHRACGSRVSVLLGSLIFVSLRVCACATLSRVRLFATPQTVARQAPVHAISQTGIREWVAFPFSKESSGPKDWT